MREGELGQESDEERCGRERREREIERERERERQTSRYVGRSWGICREGGRRVRGGTRGAREREGEKP